ncbi:hypothetical protein [Cellulophaga baltica]|uniref:General stress protein CsbD n=1 Tax=Cellulophaga baltica 18 TaxID=1348584 RepID=A0AAU8RCR8_9FLAO|nr:hypothetical protein [Cellulophaga baltica]AIZ41152.1 hypothetical protein M666_05965 [Cellulophaga baltica 18]
MITENKNQHKDRKYGGLDNTVQQNHSLDQPLEDKESTNNLGEDVAQPVNNGGVEASILDFDLEEQWLAVRDEYLAHYPDILESETQYEKGSFNTIIENLAKRRQRTPKEIHTEIKNWNAKK